MKNLSTREMAYIAICVALISICSWISIPFTVPFTLQTFAVFLVLLLLGGKNGTISIIIYILLGAVGLPVFSGFRGGIGMLFGTTGGYIWGFIIIGIIYWISQRFKNTNDIKTLIVMIIGLFACYTLGTVWFMIVYARSSGPAGIITALSWCVFPFIIPDIIKLTLSLFLSKKIKPFMYK